jgi:hypothetical protein
MLIKARNFEPLPGTVYVVTGYQTTFMGELVAQGVFKTLKAAITLKGRIEKEGKTADLRVGHFLPSGNIETI